jgi:hypothetical protein
MNLGQSDMTFIVPLFPSFFLFFFLSLYTFSSLFILILYISLLSPFVSFFRPFFFLSFSLHFIFIIHNSSLHFFIFSYCIFLQTFLLSFFLSTLSLHYSYFFFTFLYCLLFYLSSDLSMRMSVWYLQTCAQQHLPFALTEITVLCWCISFSSNSCLSNN